MPKPNAPTHRRPDALAGVALPSNRRFGALMAAVALLGCAYAYWKGAATAGAWLAAAAVVLAALTVMAPQWLAPANRAWMRLGLLMGAIVSPIVLGLMFFGMITPMALVMRLAGRDIMRRRPPKGLESYWITREPPGPRPGSLDQQF